MGFSLTRAATYGLHAMSALAAIKEGKWTASHVIAAARQIPDRFLLKVLKPLADRKLLTSMKGPNGGYRLAKPPNKITVLEIIEAIDGPMNAHVPEMGSKTGAQLQKGVTGLLERSTETIRKQWNGVSLADLMGSKAG